jgi:hypothetical protein
MTQYDEVVTLADQLPLVERARLLEHLSGTLKRDLDIEAFRRMPWTEFSERTSGSLANDPIERPPQLPLEAREPIFI